jgi:hypothetical protein
MDGDMDGISLRLEGASRLLMHALAPSRRQLFCAAGVVNFAEFSRFLRLDDVEVDSALHKGKSSKDELAPSTWHESAEL